MWVSHLAGYSPSPYPTANSINDLYISHLVSTRDTPMSGVVIVEGSKRRRRWGSGRTGTRSRLMYRVRVVVRSEDGSAV